MAAEPMAKPSKNWWKERAMSRVVKEVPLATPSVMPIMTGGGAGEGAKGRGSHDAETGGLQSTGLSAQPAGRPVQLPEWNTMPASVK
jgi:hypothetical protein